MKMKKAMTQKRRERIRREILALLSEEPGLFRREINKRLAVSFALGAAELSDNTPDSRKNLLFSAIGTVLSDLCRDGTLHRSAEGRYILKKDAHVAVRDAACRDFLLSLLEGEALTRSEIYESAEGHFGTKRTPTPKDDHALRSMTGSLLDALVREGELSREGELYRRTVHDREFFENGDDERLRRLYLSLLHRQGGAFFERFTVSLLRDYYRRTGRTVTVAEVSGGADDGGIDGRIETRDALGFSEIVLLQTKCRREHLHVTEREVRGFYGAMRAKGGTRGIFVTTSYFHEAARRFFDALPDCVGIDGVQLFSLIRECSYGLRHTPEGYTVDRSFFRESL
ncbi:MAG: restriction endonuclease [Clostridia bacterium]|nr:restriction endonuclease [Clostridia bacterium]